MTTYQILCLIGVPGILSALVAWMVKQAGAIKAVKLGIQAILRDSLLRSYKACSEKGCATIEEKSNFLNMYVQYHSLGVNGVMDDIKLKFMALPIQNGDESYV